jgi:hypothetical protein
MNRPHYFCHISLMVLSTAALAQVPAAAPAPAQAAPLATPPAQAQASSPAA